MRVFNTGRIHTRGGAVSSIKSWSAKVRLDVPVFLIEHPEGPVLFDSGLDGETAAKMHAGWLARKIASFESSSGQDAASQLAAAGVAPESVRWVVLSHAHPDHMSGLARYPNATVVVSRREWERAKEASSSTPPAKRRVDPQALESRIKLRLLDFDDQPPYGAFDHAVDLFSDGSIFLVPLPGHTSGSIGAWVNLDGGPALLAGDAAWVIDNYLDLAFPHERAMEDPVAYRHSIDTMRAMQRVVPRLVIFPGHDLTPLALSGRQDIPVAPFAASPK